MSGLDSAARGLAVRAGRDAARRSRVLIAAGPSGPVHGVAGSDWVTVHRTTLPPDTIVGGAELRMRLLFAKYQPFNASHRWRLRLGGIVIGQNTVGASMATLAVEQTIQMAFDRKSAFTYSLNAFDTPSVNTAGLYAITGARTGIAANLGARAPSASIMFVSNSAPPTVETVLVDFAQPVEVAIDVYAINGDTVEALGVSLEMLAPGPVPVNSCHPRALAAWGDSLTEGTGSAAVSGVPMDWVAQLRRQLAGRPVAAKGLGGQKSAAIVDRLLADPVAGRQWDGVLWIGANDFDDNVGNGPGWWSAIRTQIDRALAFRRTPNTILCNLHPRANWAVGDASYQAMQYVNAQLAATYGARVCDLFAALATDNGKVPAASMFDNIHLANPGHATVMQAVAAKIASLGWN